MDGLVFQKMACMKYVHTVTRSLIEVDRMKRKSEDRSFHQQKEGGELAKRAKVQTMQVYNKTLGGIISIIYKLRVNNVQPQHIAVYRNPNNDQQVWRDVE